ncbi:MAG: hypothetical protein NXI22_21890 [bacterium]|nr:hypothetical protein [bacterium]
MTSSDTSPAKMFPADRIRVDARSMHLGVPPMGGCPDPNIEVVTKDGVVAAIEITCSCGQQIKLVCDYS